MAGRPLRILGLTALLVVGAQPALGVLEVQNLTARYGGRPVVQGVLFKADRGVVVLAGPNGAGKSTVLRGLATLLPFEGAVSMAGCDLASARGKRSARARLGFLPQEAAFPGDFTVAEAVTYAAWLQRVPARRRPEAVRDALDAVEVLYVAAPRPRRD